MERKYIYFHTGQGFVAMVFGILLMVPLTLELLSWLPRSIWIHIPVVLVSAILVAWIAFKVDESSLKKRNQSTQRKR